MHELGRAANRTFICIIEILVLFMKVLYVKVGAAYVIYLSYVIDNKIFCRPLKGERFRNRTAFTQCICPSYFAVDFLHLKKTRPLIHVLCLNWSKQPKLNLNAYLFCVTAPSPINQLKGRFELNRLISVGSFKINQHFSGLGTGKSAFLFPSLILFSVLRFERICRKKSYQ